MRTFITATVIGLAALAAPATSFAAGHTTKPAVVHTYEVISGDYTTKAKAEAREIRLTNAGYTGFRVVEKNKRFLDVWGPATLRQAKAEQHRLLLKKFKGSIKQVK